jgi:hypothetical protein
MTRAGNTGPERHGRVEDIAATLVFIVGTNAIVAPGAKLSADGGTNA